MNVLIAKSLLARSIDISFVQQANFKLVTTESPHRPCQSGLCVISSLTISQVYDPKTITDFNLENEVVLDIRHQNMNRLQSRMASYESVLAGITPILVNSCLDILWSRSGKEQSYFLFE